MTIDELFRKLATGGIIIGILLVASYILWQRAAAIVNMPLIT